MKSGIYLITSPKGRQYVGQSVNIQKRHSNYNAKGMARLQNSFNKYGRENHTFEIIEYCTVDKLDEYENYYMVLLGTCNAENGLNLMLPHGGIKKHSPESNQKNREAHLGKKASAETKALLSKIRTGRVVPPEVGRNISKAKKGKKATEAHKLAMSESRLKHPRLKEIMHNLNKDRGKAVINIVTGIIYPSAKIAAFEEGYPVGSLTPMLNGNRPVNKTNLRYL